MPKQVFKKIYEWVKTIPAGQVSTYGEVGQKVGVDPRIVGFALHANQDPWVPCHRVVNKEGRLAPNFAFGDGWKEQRRRLLAEGVKFRDEMHVEI